MLFAISGTALAEEPKGFGEIARFAEKGDNPGQLDEARTHAIGVDPTDNSVYAVDEAVEPVVAGGKITRHFRAAEVHRIRRQIRGQRVCDLDETSPLSTKGS